MTLIAHQLTLRAAGKTLCRSFNVTMGPGEIWGVLGKNGCGKTSFLHCLAGLTQPASGRIVLENQNLEAYSYGQRAKKIGLLLQQRENYFPSQVLETILMGRYPHTKGWRRPSSQDLSLVYNLMELLDLTPHQHKNLTTLSGGERQRVAIATLLAQEPKVYLLDEPCNHLDLAYQLKILKYCRQQTTQHGKTMVMALHDVNQVARFCDHVILFFAHGVVKAGPVCDLLNEKTLSKVYQHPILSVATPQGSLFFAEQKLN